jgi:hypothetical protein
MVWITTIDFPDEIGEGIMPRGLVLEEGRDAMEMNEYVLEALVREKLDGARAMTARRALVAACHPPRAPLRARVGTALIALGERLTGAAAPRAGAPPRACATPSASHG